MNTTTLIAILEDDIIEDGSKVYRLVSFDNGKDPSAVQLYVNAYGKVGQAMKDLPSGSPALFFGSFHLVKGDDNIPYAEFDAKSVELAPNLSCSAYTQVVGNLGADPEMRPLGDSKIANISVYSRKDREHTDVFRCSLFYVNAENAEKHMRKGGRVAIGGRLTFNMSNDSVYWQVNCDNYELLGSGKSEGASSPKPPTPKVGVKPVAPALVTAGSTEEPPF